MRQEAGSLLQHTSTAGIIQSPQQLPSSLPRTATIKSPIISEHCHTRDQAPTTRTFGGNRIYATVCTNVPQHDLRLPHPVCELPMCTISRVRAGCRNSLPTHVSPANPLLRALGCSTLHPAPTSSAMPSRDCAPPSLLILAPLLEEPFIFLTVLLQNP